MKAIFLAFCLLMMMVPKWTVGQFRSGDNLVIDDAVDQDLYVAGVTVTINEPISGDLIVAGGTITVNDSVAQDVLVGPCLDVNRITEAVDSSYTNRLPQKLTNRRMLN